MGYATNKQIIKFIEDFKEYSSKDIEHVFFHGYCYWFAVILAHRFKGDIWFNPNMVHFAACIKKDLYDIYGKVKPGINPETGEYREEYNDWIPWDRFQIENHEVAEAVILSCIKKC